MKTAAIWLIVLLALAILPACGGQDSEQLEDQIGTTGSALTAAQWATATQSARNQAILDRAWPDNNQNVHLNCKMWVQTVVESASGIANIIPTTANDWTWNTNQYVVGACGGITTAQPGWIVQMQVRHLDGSLGPHTAIVQGTNVSCSRGPGVVFIESNWCLHNCNTVHTRCVPFSDFGSAAIPRYSTYYVGYNGPLSCYR